MKIEWEATSTLRRVELWVDDYYAAHVQQLPDMSWVIFMWTISEMRWAMQQDLIFDDLETAKAVAMALVVMR